MESTLPVDGGAEITFLSDEFADHCTAVSCRPIHYGQHFFEFIIHSFSNSSAESVLAQLLSCWPISESSRVLQVTSCDVV